MKFSNIETIVKEQKHIIGIEPVIDIYHFALLLLTDLALKSDLCDLNNPDIKKACLPLEYLDIIEEIMYEENGWGILFNELIDSPVYYEYQDEWEKDLGRNIKKVLMEESLKYDIDLESNRLVIDFDLNKIILIRSMFDKKSLQDIDCFSQIIMDYLLCRRNELDNKLFGRKMSRLKYDSSNFNNLVLRIRKPIVK